MKTVEIIVLLYTYISTTKAAKILAIFIAAGHSHFTCNNAVMKSLSKAGHEIAMVTHFANEAARENYSSIIDISKGEFIYIGQTKVEDFSRMTTFDLIEFLSTEELRMCEKVLNLKEIQDAFKSEKKLFDVIFVEILVSSHCLYWIGKKLNIPVIGIVTARDSVMADEDISNPRHPLLVPIQFRTINQKTFYVSLESVWNFVKILGKYYWDIVVKGIYGSIYRKYFERYNISYEELRKFRPSLTFINSHSSYYPRPMNPNVIEIGGITLTENKELPQNVQAFLDGAKHGAILFTLGSVIRASTVPQNKIRAFVEAFAEIPQRVIWKYEEQLDGVSDNVMVMKWVPQKDILVQHDNKLESKAVMYYWIILGSILILTGYKEIETDRYHF